MKTSIHRCLTITHAKGSISAPRRNASAREQKSSLLTLTGPLPLELTFWRRKMLLYAYLVLCTSFWARNLDVKRSQANVTLGYWYCAHLCCTDIHAQCVMLAASLHAPRYMGRGEKGQHVTINLNILMAPLAHNGFSPAGISLFDRAQEAQFECV